MTPSRWLIAAVVLVLAGCQAPAPVTPTAALAVPTVAPAVPTPLPVASTPVPAAPTVAPQPTPPPATATRVETLNAANVAYRAGNLKAAAGLYDRVVNTPPGAAEAAAATSAINDFAWFRSMITLLADGRDDDAKLAHDALVKRDPNAPLARLGDQLYNQYGMVGQLRGACAQLQPQLPIQAGPTLATLQSLGVTNIDAATLCSVPAS